MHRFINLPAMTLVLITTSMVGCKQRSSDSDIKSLDNFAGDQTINACGGAFDVLPTANIQTNRTHLNEVRLALTSIPPSMQRAYFEDLRGSIIVTSDMSACKTANVRSCWAPVGDDAVAIYVKEESNAAKTAQNIRHSLVRSFGYLTVQLMLKLNQTEQGSVLADNAALKEFKNDLTLSLLDDVAKSKKYSLSAFKGSLSGKLLDDRSRANERSAAWSAISGSTAGQTFADSVLAETFDSYYCSAVSRAKMKKEFAGSYAQMTDYAGTLEKLFTGKLDAEIAALSDSEGSYGLWFPGRGLIRGAAAVGRGWSNWRANGRGLFNFRRAADGGGLIVRGGVFGNKFIGQETISQSSAFDEIAATETTTTAPQIAATEAVVAPETTESQIASSNVISQDAPLFSDETGLALK